MSIIPNALPYSVTSYAITPSSPTGELLTLGRICQKHHVTVFSDEIHADFVWQGEHHVFAAVDPAFAQFSMIATSPSKTFYIAGLQMSNLFIP